MKSLWHWLKHRFFPAADWREEIQSHLEMRREWHQTHSQLPNNEAERLANKQFGNTTRTFESVRDLYPARRLDDFAQDLRHALRLLRRRPAFALSVILIFALGIGAATAIFSIVDPLLFRPLPFRDGGRLVSFGLLGPIDTDEFSLGGMYLQWRERQTSFSQLSAMQPGGQCDVEAAQMQRVPCARVEGNFLSMLGVQPSLGRSFDSLEDVPHAPLTVLISDRLWHTAFASRKDLLNQTVKIDDRPVRVIGILPADFILPQGAEVDLLLPTQFDRTALQSPNSTVVLRCFARLKPGLSIAEARRRFEPLYQATLAAVPKELRSEIRFMLQSVRDRSIHSAKQASWLLFGAVLFLLLLVCLTIANLLFARAITRQEEFAMRSTLGASRGRLFSQSLTETAVLAITGAVLGSGLGFLLIRTLTHFVPGGFLRLDQIHLDARILLFALAAALTTAIVAGVVPALLKPPPYFIRAWGAVTLRRARFRKLLVILQFACSLILLAAALLFSRSLSEVETDSLGFSGEQLISATFSASHSRYAQADKLRALYANLETRLSQIPGISSWALSDSMPPAGAMHGRPLANIIVAGHASPQGGGTMVGFRYITPSYFKTLNIPLLSGCSFPDNASGAESSIIISENLAHRLFGIENPIGHRIALDGPGSPWLAVIGVARDVKNNGIDVPLSPEYYRLRSQTTNSLGHTAVALLRTPLGVATVSDWIAREASLVDPSLTFKIENMQSRLYHLSDRPRFIAAVVGIFAIVSLILAASGLFGVIGFLITNRTREIAVRSALGATHFDLLWLVQKQIAVWAISGTAIGLAGSLLLGRFVKGLLYRIAPTDVPSLLAACLIMLCVAALAAWLPSRRVTRIDPALTLRAE